MKALLTKVWVNSFFIQFDTMPNAFLTIIDVGESICRHAMEEGVAVSKGDYFNIAHTFVASAGFKIITPCFLSMPIDMQNDFNQPTFRTI